MEIKQKLEAYLKEHTRGISEIATGAHKSEEAELIGEALEEIKNSVKIVRCGKCCKKHFCSSIQNDHFEDDDFCSYGEAE